MARRYKQQQAKAKGRDTSNAPRPSQPQRSRGYRGTALSKGRPTPLSCLNCYRWSRHCWATKAIPSSKVDRQFPGIPVCNECWGWCHANLDTICVVEFRHFAIAKLNKWGATSRSILGGASVNFIVGNPAAIEDWEESMANAPSAPGGTAPGTPPTNETDR